MILPGKVDIFQFHYGAVLSFLRPQTLSVYPISIPLWCGSEGLAYLGQATSVIFQFHYGAVLSLSEIASATQDSNFNSTMVRF